MPHIKGELAFQSTHPCGVRLAVSMLQAVSTQFQSTHPCGVRRDYRIQPSVSFCCFNPRTRVGCDFCQVCMIYIKSVVSIHAPVWGATPTACQSPRRISFNPRTRVGCDPRDCPVQLVAKVSIHAPVWGATRQTTMTAQILSVSIHAPVWGATTLDTPTVTMTGFNPRTRVGCD